MKVGFLTITPSPYIREMFEVLAKDGRIKPTVYFQELSSPAFNWHATELPAYWKHLPSKTVSLMGARIFFCPTAIQEVSRQSHDVFVVGGYASLTSQRLMRWLHRQRVPWVFWGEIPGYQKRGLLGRFLRTMAMIPVTHHCNGVAAVGQRAADFYRAVVRQRCPVSSIPYYSDVSAFYRLRGFRDALRTGPIRLLFCGQIVERKGILVLIRVIKRLIAERPGCLHLTLVGRGELESKIRSMLSPDFIRSVSFEGFRQVHELPAYFEEADVFVLPSLHDGWGVVINQALAAGLPIISTDAVGAAQDLVLDGVNGRIVSAGSDEELYHALMQLIQSMQDRVRMGAASRRVIENWTPQAEADRWFGLLKSVLDASDSAR